MSKKSDSSLLSVIPWRELGTAWRDAGLLLLVATVAAFIFNAIRPNGIPVIRYAPFDLLGPCPEIQEEIPELAIDKLRPQDPHVRVVDVRMPWDYAAGHIPGAVCIPLYETTPMPPAQVETLKKLPPGTWVVLVDDTGGMTARRALSALAQEGLRGLFVLTGGMNAWKQAKRPLEKLDIPVTDDIPPAGAGAVVDARPEEAQPSLPNAVPLPFDDLLPPDEETVQTLKKAAKPIFVISDQALPEQPAETRPVHPGWGVAAQLRVLGVSDVKVVRRPVTKGSANVPATSEDAP